MKKITISSLATIRKAMSTLDKTAEKCLLVTDETGRFLGTLTDGDIRRAILSGIGVSEAISSIYCKEPTVLTQGSFTPETAKEILREKKLALLPVLDNQGCVTDFVTWQRLGLSQTNKESLSHMPVVIMAGGKGSRLKPLTNFLPKPLVPIGHETTLIERIIKQFTDFGCNEFLISVNYKAKLIKAYFDELNPDYKVRFLEEEKPLGTIGSIALAKNQIKGSFFVTNCDILVSANLHDLQQHHLQGQHMATITASAKNHVIPYGTCELSEDGSLAKITEKPSQELLINSGLYVFEPTVFDIIPSDTQFHATELIENLIKDSKKVGVFPINFDSWQDLGQMSLYNNFLQS
ncbi:sugar phosphate nucleotidyltransferase [Opitutales bacterium]|nr:sugar phosphate nucleotidyltransferase [Opitutales bacterium]